MVAAVTSLFAIGAGLIEKVRGVGFLEKGVTDVLFIAENLVDGTGVPFWFSGTVENPVSFKTGGNLHVMHWLNGNRGTLWECISFW